MYKQTISTFGLVALLSIGCDAASYDDSGIVEDNEGKFDQSMPTGKFVNDNGAPLYSLTLASDKTFVRQIETCDVHANCRKHSESGTVKLGKKNGRTYLNFYMDGELKDAYQYKVTTGGNHIELRKVGTSDWWTFIRQGGGAATTDAWVAEVKAYLEKHGVVGLTDAPWEDVPLKARDAMEFMNQRAPEDSDGADIGTLEVNDLPVYVVSGVVYRSQDGDDESTRYEVQVFDSKKKIATGEIKRDEDYQFIAIEWD